MAKNNDPLGDGRAFKAFLFDVDQTVTKSAQVILPDMAAVLDELQGEIGFISGTGVDELKRMISSLLHRRHHLLGNTGTHYVIVNPRAGDTEVVKESLTSGQKDELIMAIKKLKTKYNLLPMTTEADQIQDRDSQVTFSILGRHAPLEAKYAYDPDKKKRLEFVSFLSKLIDSKKYAITIGGTTSIDITMKDRAKDNAVRLFMKTANLSKEDVVFFGDQLQPGGNDFEAKKSGVTCVEVKDPDETLYILRKIVESNHGE